MPIDPQERSFARWDIIRTLQPGRGAPALPARGPVGLILPRLSLHRVFRGVSPMLTRRALLKRSALLSLAPTMPAFLARTAMSAPTVGDGRALVVVQLDGGNDGI